MTLVYVITYAFLGVVDVGGLVGVVGDFFSFFLAAPRFLPSCGFGRFTVLVSSNAIKNPSCSPSGAVAAGAAGAACEISGSVKF